MKLFTLGQQVIKDFMEKLKTLHPEARRIEIHLTTKVYVWTAFKNEMLLGEAMQTRGKNIAKVYVPSEQKSWSGHTTCKLEKEYSLEELGLK